MRNVLLFIIIAIPIIGYIAAYGDWKTYLKTSNEIQKLDIWDIDFRCFFGFVRCRVLPCKDNRNIPFA